MRHSVNSRGLVTASPIEIFYGYDPVFRTETWMPFPRKTTGKTEIFAPLRVTVFLNALGGRVPDQLMDLQTKTSRDVIGKNPFGELLRIQ